MAAGRFAARSHENAGSASHISLLMCKRGGPLRAVLSLRKTLIFLLVNYRAGFFPARAQLAITRGRIFLTDLLYSHFAIMELFAVLTSAIFSETKTKTKNRLTVKQLGYI